MDGQEELQLAPQRKEAVNLREERTKEGPMSGTEEALTMQPTLFTHAGNKKTYPNCDSVSAAGHSVRKCVTDSSSPKYHLPSGLSVAVSREVLPLFAPIQCLEELTVSCRCTFYM
ncbi:hypothetical protein JTB14_021947 [Gonioctena quinquepunctata]|nr:hypothetical protein JTB14_021947 [Gonioctena quinquepunctata]